MTTEGAARTITVASTVDAGFLPYAGVVAASMARFADPGRPIDYRVFYAGPDNADRKALDGAKVGPVTLRVLDAPAIVDRYRGRSVMGTATLVRVLAAELMPDADRALFLDADLLVLDDIAALFDAELGGRPLGAVVDFTIYTWLQEQRTTPPQYPIHNLPKLLGEMIGFTAADWFDYVNTGVITMDLAALRAEGFSERAIALLDEKAHLLPWPDQDLINILLKGRIKFFEPRWNVLMKVLKRPIPKDVDPFVQEGMRAQKQNPAIVHFAGAAKPWLRSNHSPYSGVWWHFADQSPLGKDIRAGYRQRRRAGRRLPDPLTAVETAFARLKYGAAPVRESLA